MVPLKYSIPTVLSNYVLCSFIGSGNGPYVYTTNTSGIWTDGMLLTMTIHLNNSLPVLSHYADPFIMGRYVIYVPVSENVYLCEVEVVGRCLFLSECRLIWNAI
jgi:hypothetical protein